jgi:16S rRNA (uracil1498-N3)-methyltransferase
MAVHHFFTPPENVDGDTVVLTGEEAHHAARVVRLRIGEHITIADGNGRVYDASVRSLDGDVACAIEDVHDVAVPRPVITIHQALVKGDRMDDMIERSVEVGVRRIVPFEAERSIVRWDAAKRDKAYVRWNEIARAASKQSRSPWLTTVDPVQDAPPREGFVLHEDATTRLRDALPPEAPEHLTLVVGPEGSFAPAELEGRCTVSLGERILRSEFAGPVAATIVSFVYGSLG